MRKTFLLLVVSICCLAAHPIEKMSVGEVTYANNEILLKVRMFEEDLQPALRRLGLDPEVSFRNYMDKPFDSKILPAIEAYLKSNLEIAVNGTVLVPSVNNIDWVVKSKFSDHAAIQVEITYPCGKGKQVSVLKVKNTLLLKEVYGQTNILNIEVLGKHSVFTFERGREIQELRF